MLHTAKTKSMFFPLCQYVDYYFNSDESSYAYFALHFCNNVKLYTCLDYLHYFIIISFEFSSK